MIKNIFFILSLLVATVSCDQSNKQIEIPFTMDRNLIIIKAHLDKNVTNNFIFDTGTEGIMLLDSIAISMKFLDQILW
jgi:hypothetical protein